MNNDKGKIFVLSAPSGAGKTTLEKWAIENIPNLKRTISITTRKAREGEEDGIDYQFVSNPTFTSLSKWKLAEHTTIYEHKYGTLKKDINDIIDNGHNLIMVLDYNGMRQIKQSYDNMISIYILPPTKEVLIKRLTNRGDKYMDIIKRVGKIDAEVIAFSNLYNFNIVNEDLDQAKKDLKNIILTT
jgi:guanylate kinase